MHGDGDREVMLSNLDEPLLPKTSLICPAGGMTIRANKQLSHQWLG